MGSSTRKIQKKIKDILKQGGNDQQLDVAIPKVVNETLRLKRSKKYFGDKDFVNLMSGGLASIASISSGTFKREYDIEFDFDGEQLTELSVEKIIENILDRVEQNEQIENSLILSAFKASMADLILNKDITSIGFVSKFITNVLYLLIMENINEALLEQFEEVHTNDFDDRIKKFANNVVSTNMKDYIASFTRGNSTLEDLISQLAELHSSIQVGELNEQN